jgi:hypothetical protein
MKTVIGLAAALALTLSAVSARAGDMFQALSTIPAGEQARLTPLDDDQLAAVAGENLEDLLALVQLLISTATNHDAVLTSQILFLIQVQLNTEPTAAAQRNVVEVIQRQGNTVSLTRQSMW